MDVDSTEDASSPPIHLSSSSPPGYSIPIRAPLTIDSDSEFCLCINDQIYSRTSSFNSSSSSIDIGSYGDEHTSVFEEENDAFVAYPDKEIVIEYSLVEEYSYTRPFVKYPDANDVNESSNFNESAIFRPYVKIPCEESSSADFGIKLGVPIAPLTSDCDSDSDSDVDSVDGRRWLDSGRVPADGILRKVAMPPKAGISNGDEGEDQVDDELQVEGLFSGDDSIGVEELNSVSAESIEDEGCKVECLNEVLKLSESDESSFDLERIDAQIVSGSNNEIEIETINAKLSDSDELSFDSERIDAQIVSNSDSDIEIKTINESKQEIVIEKEEEMLDKMQSIRETFLKLALGKKLTKKVNGEGCNNKFDFQLTILAIGKTGVGKSATINSIFGETKAITNAFDPGTTNIQEIIGNVDGIQLRVIDTPGLKCSSSERSYNLRILKSIKRFTQKCTPDIVLYVDRLDTHTRDVNDSQLLRLITSSLGSSVWRNCIIALTHATCNPPDEPLGGFVVQRCRFVQEQIVSGGGSNWHMANPVWLVDNHPTYRHDIIDLGCGLKGLACFDLANEDDGCGQVPPFEPLSESRDIINRCVERKKAYFIEYGYRVKLLGNNHWSLGCRLCF